MSESFPFFSIIIPTYNRAHLVGKTIESVLQQQYTNFEILIIDDGSRDNTEDVIKQFNDPCIQYYQKENAERGAARNYGRARAKGLYVNFFDSDDLMYPNHLRVAKKLIEDKNSPDFFHLGYDFKTDDGVVTKKVDQLLDDIQPKALFDNFLSCNGMFVRKDIAEKFPFEEDRILSSAEDWELWVRLMSRYKLHYSNEITTSVVGHDQRSIRTIATDKIINRDLLLISYLKADAEVLRAYGKQFGRFVAERYTFFMLCLAEDNERAEVISWAFRAIRVYPLILTSKRFLASIKKIIFP